MKLKLTLALSCALLTAGSAQAQTAANYVTEVVTDFGGYWRSGTGSGPNAPANAIKPNNSHLLLAFMLGGTRYSTGVNDALLDSKGLSYTAAPFQGLAPSGPSATMTGNTKIALGQLYDGVNNGPSSPPPANGYATYLADGTQGLNLGTGVANLSAGTFNFPLNPVKRAAIGDGVPDVLMTQIASPGATDRYRFVDASGSVIGNSITVDMGAVTAVGNWTADFYEASQTPMTLGSGFANTDRPLRLWAADFSTFGLVPADYTRIAGFQLVMGGDSDPAFVAYNSNSSSASPTIGPLPVVLTAFAGEADGSAALLTWRTASEQNARAFVVETSPDGRTFEAVGEVAAAGTSPQARYYKFRHAAARPGLRYYRLHLLDTDGTGSYSAVVAVGTGAAAVAVFPSVFDQDLIVRLPAAGTTALTLLAADGRPVLQRTLTDGAAQDLALPGAGSLVPGLYLLRVVVDGQASTHRVVKQ